MTRAIWWVIGQVFGCVYALAQTPDSTKPILALKILPSAAFDINATYQLAAEIFLSNRASIQPELGYGLGQYMPKAYQNNNDLNQQVWRGRLEYRFYKKDVQLGKSTFYQGIDVFFKEVITPKTTEVGRTCDPTTGRCAYFEQVPYDDVKRVIGLHYKWGTQAISTKNLAFDFYWGGGLRVIEVSKRNFPEEALDERSIFSFVRLPGTYVGIDILLGIRFGYVFKRKQTSTY